MNYKVVWEEGARAEVASEFVKSNDKVAIIDASYQLDRALESDPIGNGQPLSEGIFYLIVHHCGQSIRSMWTCDKSMSVAFVEFLSALLG